MARYLHLYYAFLRNSLLRDMSFRANFIIECISSMSWTVMMMGFYLLIFQYADQVAGWEKWDFFAFLATSLIVNSFVGIIGRTPKSIRAAHVRDGLINTLLVGETLPGHCQWNGAYYSNFPLSSTTTPLGTMKSDFQGEGNWQHSCGYKSLHPGGASFTLGDGSVRFVSSSIDYQLFNNLGSRAGGEAVQVP